MVALDIGGVVATINKKPFKAFLRENQIDESDFFDQDFSLLQSGKIHPAHFFRKKSRTHHVGIDDLIAAFKSIIDAHPAHEVMEKIKIPYIFLSNINQIHFHEMCNQIKLRDFALENSILSYQVGFEKPATEFFKARSNAIVPSETIYIDDQPFSLVRANAFGFITAHCPKPETLSTVLTQWGLI